MSNCNESDLISGYIDNELSATDIATLESHLHACRDCREEVRDLRQVKVLTGDVPSLAAPADFTATLIAQAVAARNEAIVRQRTQMPAWLGGLAAAAALVIWIGLRGAAMPAAIPMDALVAAHSRQTDGTLHDRLQSASVYSDYLKRSAENARS